MGGQDKKERRKKEKKGGTERNRKERRNGTEQNGTERNRMERNGTERNGTERNGTVLVRSSGDFCDQLAKRLTRELSTESMQNIQVQATVEVMAILGEILGAIRGSKNKG